MTKRGQNGRKRVKNERKKAKTGEKLAKTGHNGPRRARRHGWKRPSRSTAKTWTKRAKTGQKRAKTDEKERKRAQNGPRTGRGTRSHLGGPRAPGDPPMGPQHEKYKVRSIHGNNDSRAPLWPNTAFLGRNQPNLQITWLFCGPGKRCSKPSRKLQVKLGGGDAPRV